MVLLALALIESSWGRLISIGGVHPDLVLVAVLSWSLLSGPVEGLVWAVLGGLCLSILSHAPFGLVTIPLVLVSLLTRLGYTRSFGGYLVFPLLLAFPLSLAYYMSHLLLLDLLGWPVDWNPTLVQVILPASLLNTVAVLFVFPLLRSIHRHTGRETIGW